MNVEARVECGTMFPCPLQTVTKPKERNLHWIPTEQQLRKHLAIFGGTRFGKSKLLEQIGRELMQNGSGFAFIDPNSDTAEALLAYAAFHRESLGGIADEIHYLNPLRRLFSIDLFHYEPHKDDFDEDFLPFGIHPDEDDEDFLYQCWLHKKVNAMAAVIVRPQGETEDEQRKMVRLRRWLRNALYAIGTRQRDGSHYPLSDIFAILDPLCSRFPELYPRVEHAMPEEIRLDFEKLASMRSARQIEDFTESTVNRLRDICSPIFKMIYGLQAPPIDTRQIVQRGEIIIASLGPHGDYLDAETCHAIGGLLILEIRRALQVSAEHRSQYHLFIDEAHNYLGEDLLRTLQEGAKYGTSVGLAMQGLDNLQSDKVDLVPAVLNNCGVRITFRQKYHDHAEILAKNLGCSLLDFTKLIHTVERHGQYQWVKVPTVTESSTWSEVTTHGGGSANAEGRSTGAVVGETQNKSRSNISDWMSGDIVQVSAALSAGATRSSSESAMASNITSSFGSHSNSRGGGSSVSWSLTPLHIPREERQDTGKLKNSISDQHARITYVIMHLLKQFCLVATDDDTTFILRVADVLDPFDDHYKTEWTKKKSLAAFLEHLFSIHPYYFIPRTSTGGNGAAGNSDIGMPFLPPEE